MTGHQDTRHKPQSNSRTPKGSAMSNFASPTPVRLLAILDDSVKRNYMEMVNAWPIFGGENDENGSGGSGSGSGESGGSGGNGNSTSGAGNAAGGGSGDGEDPIKKLQSDPNALAQLLSQTQTLNSTVSDLQTKLEAATTENAGFKQKQEESEAAQRTKEQNQEIEINKLKGQLETVTALLQQKVVENAIASNAKHQWHSARQVQGELDMSKLKVNLDIDKGVAEIDGMDAELDRIATASPWLVKNVENQNSGGNGNGTPPRQRTSGNPPRPPAGPQDKASKRAAAMKKFPVLANGSGLPHVQ